MVRQQPGLTERGHGLRPGPYAGLQAGLRPRGYGVLFELSANTGMVLSHDQMLLRVWGVAHSGDAGLVRTIVTRLRRKLGDNADELRYIFTEPGVGYHMGHGEKANEGTP